MTIKFGSDTIQSYTGFRTISRGVIGGVQRPLLNGEFIFPFGPLDQGFWPGESWKMQHDTLQSQTNV